MVKKLNQLWLGKRACEEIALTIPASEIEQTLELLRGLDALRHDLEGEPKSEAENGLHECRRSRVVLDLIDKDLVDLDDVYREASQITQ